MTLEQYAFLAEIIGVLLIIASLVYLARQLRHNTEVTRSESASRLVDTTFQLAGDMARDRELAEVWIKAGSDFSSLDEVDQQRAIMFEYRAIQAWAHLFRLRHRGLLPDAQWSELVWAISNFAGRREDVREAWKMFRDGYTEEFQNFIKTCFDAAK